MQTDQFHDDECNTLRQSGVDSIPPVKVKDGRDHIVPGFNEFLHTAARTDYIAWRDASKPRSGLICSNVKRPRLKFKYALRQCKQNEDAIIANEHAKSLMNKDMKSFWRGIRKSNNSRLLLATTVNHSTGESNIAEMWKDHYTAILNSVGISRYTSKVNVNEQIAQIDTDSIKLTISNISDALKSLKKGKACGVDGLAAEHYIYAHSISHVFSSLLFNYFIVHGYTIWFYENFIGSYY